MDEVFDLTQEDDDVFDRQHHVAAPVRRSAHTTSQSSQPDINSDTIELDLDSDSESDSDSDSDSNDSLRFAKPLAQRMGVERPASPAVEVAKPPLKRKVKPEVAAPKPAVQRATVSISTRETIELLSSSDDDSDESDDDMPRIHIRCTKSEQPPATHGPAVHNPSPKRVKATVVKAEDRPSSWIAPAGVPRPSRTRPPNNGLSKQEKARAKAEERKINKDRRAEERRLAKEQAVQNRVRRHP